MSVLTQSRTSDALAEIMAQRILLLDGSMGALLYTKQLVEADYHGELLRDHPASLKNCTEALVLTQPRLIEDIHRAYLEADADIIETCTFNATSIGLAEFGLQDRVGDINKAAVELALRAAEDWTRRNPDKPRSSPAALDRRQRRCSSSPAHRPERAA